MYDRKWYQERLELIKAICDGKTIQARAPQIWIDLERLTLIDPVDQYRVKPEPTVIERNVVCKNGWLESNLGEIPNIRYTFDPETKQPIKVELI